MSGWVRFVIATLAAEEIDTARRMKKNNAIPYRRMVTRNLIADKKNTRNSVSNKNIKKWTK